MPRITNSDQVLLLLRNHLERQGRAQKTNARKPPQPSRVGTQATPIDRAQSILAKSDLPEDKLREVLVAGLLSEDFGSGFANDPNFSGLVRDVVRAIEDTEGGNDLFVDAIHQITDGSDPI